jgi:uncharacterized membrane protein YqjE
MSAEMQSSSSSDRLKSLVQAGLLYADARARLLQIEAQEAGVYVRRALVALVLLLCALAGTWLLLVPALIFWAAERFALPWTTLALGLGLLHLLVAVVMAARLWKLLGSTRLFEESIHQLQNDRAWLTGTQQQ